MNSTHLYILFFLITCSFPVLSQQEKKQIYPKLPKDIVVSYPNSNPLKQALKPVPNNALFKMEGYYLWDPSVIKVGNEYHLFASRWPANLGMEGWKTGFAFADSIQGPWVPVSKPVLNTNNPALLIRADGSTYAVGKFKPTITRNGR